MVTTELIELAIESSKNAYVPYSHFPVGADMGVKAAGGARSYADALSFVEAGATRIGTSAGVAILKGELADGDY